MRSRFVFTLALVFFVAFGAILLRDRNKLLFSVPETIDSKPLSVGTVVPDLYTKDIRGRTITLSALRGKIVLLNFFSNN